MKVLVDELCDPIEVDEPDGEIVDAPEEDPMDELGGTLEI